MLKYFLQAYHQGYRDGLHGKCASSVVPAVFNDQESDRVDQADLTSRPAYRAGFLAGCKDRTAAAGKSHKETPTEGPALTITESSLIVGKRR